MLIIIGDDGWVNEEKYKEEDMVELKEKRQTIRK